MTSVDLGWLEIERARYETLLDSLTGLPRWGLLIDRTAVALGRAARAGTEVAVFVLDDPHFADRPHDVLAVARTLQDRIRPDDTLARIGDRRFAVVCNDIRADEDRTAYVSTKPNIKTVMPFKDDGVTIEGIHATDVTLEATDVTTNEPPSDRPERIRRFGSARKCDSINGINSCVMNS